MGDKGKAFWLGLFIIVTLVIIGWFVLFLRPSLGDGKTKIRVLFSNIEKINIGTRVTFAGKPIGEVHKIKENPHARTQAPNAQGDLYVFELLLKVDSTVHVYSYDKISFATSGLLGEKTIDITPRSTPPDCPFAIETTNEVLIGNSTDRIEETMTKVMNVADSINTFIQENQEEFHTVLHSFGQASEQVRTFANEGNISSVMQKTAEAMDKATLFFSDVSQEGTFGRLIHSEDTYLKLSSVLAKFDTTLSDINRYGLLFQFSGRWQKEKRAREQKFNAFLKAGDFAPYFQEEMHRIQESIFEVSTLLENLKCCPSSQVKVDFGCLLQQVQQMQQDLELYNQALQIQECQ